MNITTLYPNKKNSKSEERKQKLRDEIIRVAYENKIPYLEVVNCVSELKDVYLEFASLNGDLALEKE